MFCLCLGEGGEEERGVSERQGGEGQRERDGTLMTIAVGILWALVSSGSALIREGGERDERDTRKKKTHTSSSPIPAPAPPPPDIAIAPPAVADRPSNAAYPCS